MDLRQYTVAKDAVEASDVSEGTGSPRVKQQYVRLNPKEPESDVKEMMDKSAAKFQAMNKRLGLLMWGLKVFNREEGATYDPSRWRQKLEEARATRIDDSSDEEHDLGRGGPGVVAAVCTRDHWDELSEEERDWCLEVICSEVEREGDEWSELARVQRNSMSADRLCAWVLPLLIGKSLEYWSRVHQVLVIALTHAIDEVRWYAAWGIGINLWVIDRNLVLRCVNALAMEATLIELARQVEEERPHRERRRLGDIETEAALIVRQRFGYPDSIAEDAYESLDISKWFGAKANGRILAILGQVPTEPAAIGGFRRTAETLVGWWDAEERERYEGRAERNHQSESSFSELLQRFVMRTSAAAAKSILAPVFEAVGRHPREIHWIVRGLTIVEDSEPNTEHFWFVWGLFAKSIRSAVWLAEIDDEHPTGSEMISAIFLGSWWKEDVRHWRSLEGYAGHVHGLFEDLPASSTVLDDYLRFLYHIGERSLPEAFIRIAKRLQFGNAKQMLRKTNTVYLLEVLLQRHVYGRPLELKRERELRDAALFLLDQLVENGSSASFRMRDDFVTPVSL